MAMTAILTQTSPALAGQAINFVLAVSNSSGSTVTVTSIAPIITTPAGLPAPSYSVNGPYAPIGSSTAVVGATQFNVPVLASGTVYFSFSAKLFAPLVSGVRSAPSPTFLVTATVQSSDGSVFQPPALDVTLSLPTFGTPNPSVQVGALQFNSPVNSPLAL